MKNMITALIIFLLTQSGDFILLMETLCVE